MLVDGDGDVLLLPATTRYESPGGGTETSTERRIIFSPEIPGRRIGSREPEWWVFREVMARARPGARASGRARGRRGDPARDRSRRAALRRHRDAVAPRATSGAVGRTARLYADGRFATADGRARFAPVALRSRALPADRFFVSTRRGKQFNSMVQRDVDPLTGADRDDILISDDRPRPHRPARLATTVVLRSATGVFRGRLRAAPIRRRQPRSALARGQRAARRRAASIRSRSSRTTTPSSRSRRPPLSARLACRSHVCSRC